MEYAQVLEKVKNELVYESGLDVNLVTSFTESNDFGKGLEIVAEQYEQAMKGVNDFNMSVPEYIIACLEREDKLKTDFYFDNEIEAEKDGFYWCDELEKWIKLNFNK